jgi:hypothetical protein
MNEYLEHKIRRISFFLRGFGQEYVPAFVHQNRLERIRQDLREGRLDEAILPRVNYYNRIAASFSLDAGAPACSDIARSEGSYYYFDLKEYLRPFPSNLKLAYRFGDNIRVPAVPTLVKSRPIGRFNSNCVLLNLDKLRHFNLFTQPDPTPFRNKRSRVSWRGALNNPLRVALINRHGSNNRHNIGYVGEPRLACELESSPKLTVREQLQNRYVISIEGYDVATNLKWIFASNSLCLMPRPKYETWFMEGTLVAAEHFVELRPDFEDLEEKIAYFDDHPDEAEAIIAAANRHYLQFLDREREAQISMLVLEKYFELAGQLPRQTCFDHPGPCEGNPPPR